MARFVHLHGHSEYSLLDGLSKINKLVKAVKDLGMDAVAITDHGVMYGAIEFYKAAREADINPIIGVEMYVAKRSHQDKEAKMDAEPFHLTVLAKNYQGYLNLMKLVSIAHLEGYYYRPRVDKKLLQEFHEGLICLSGCPAGEFIRTLESGNEDKAIEMAKEYLQIFGEGNFYFELQNHQYQELLQNQSLDPAIRQDLEHMSNLQDLTWDAVKKLSPKLGIPIVATNDYHYIKPEDAEAQDAQVCVQTGKLISDLNRLRMIDTPNLYLKSPEEMDKLFKDFPEALKNSVEIAKKCHVEIELGKAKFPIFQVPGNITPTEYLRELTFKKATEKLDLTELIKERLEYELDIIEFKKYSDYFLVVYDFIEWAHEHGIITNTRGSAAGSLVLYCLGVTNLNPLDYLLPFERFLTKQRPFMPDVDADLADDRRDEVIKYVMDKYGHDKVAHIITYGTMMGRAAVRDIGRVMAIPYGEVDRIAKLIPPPVQGFHKTLDGALKEVPELADLYRNSPQVKALMDLAKKVEGTVRHASVHAAGIIIAPGDITNFAPLQREADGDKLVTQYDMYSLVDEYGGIGLVKMDLLGLRNLSILGRAMEFVKNNKGVQVNLDKLPLNDKKTYELLTRGETMGVFQLSGSGMTRYLMDLKPTTISDLMVMVALYRPGPMAIIPEYIARKNDPSKVKFYDPRMKEYMQQSLGLFIYQEDLLFTAIKIAGYSWEEADKFRKAVGKKKPAEMAKQKDHLIDGCINNGISKERAEKLWALIEPFAAYGFPKGHAASYAMVAYQTAYMKANFPVEFMAAVMTAEYGDADKIASAIDECKRLNIVVLPPDINYSGVGFSLEELKTLSEEDLERQLTDVDKVSKQGIRFGLSAIKNVGTLAIESILKAREESQFQDLADLCARVDTRLVNRKTLESLIKAGALDSLGSRAAQLLILDPYLEASHKNAKSKNLGQVSLFNEEEVSEGGTFLKLPDVEELPLDQLLTFEKDLLGFYLHEPPFLQKLNQINDFVDVRIRDLTEEHINQKLKLGGVITGVKKVMTKRSAQEMAFVSLSDGVSEIEVVVFPSVFAPNKEIISKDEVVLIYGRVDKREEVLTVVAESVSQFDPNSMEKKLKQVEIMVPGGVDVKLLQQVNKTLRDFPGDLPVILLLQNGMEPKRMALPFLINLDPALISQIKTLLGEDALTIK